MNIAELDWEIALNTDYNTLNKLCQTSKYFKSICNNQLFWFQKYSRDFGIPGIFDVQWIDDWRRAYGLQSIVFPMIRSVVLKSSIDKISRIKEAQLAIATHGPTVVEIETIFHEGRFPDEEWRVERIFHKYTFDKLILVEHRSDGETGMYIMVHYTKNNKQHISSVTSRYFENLQLKYVDDRTNLFPGLLQRLYKEVIDDYGKFNGEDHKLYILDPYEFLLLQV